MKKLVLPLILISVILISGCITQEVGTKKGITVNTPSSSPLDLALSISSFSEEGTAEITVNIGKREGYPVENVNWTDTTAEIILPEGLELIEGNPSWEGDIIGNQIVEFKVKVNAIQNGEWKLEANSQYTITEDSWYGDIEILYVLITDDEILVSNTPFTTTKSSGIEQTI